MHHGAKLGDAGIKLLEQRLQCGGSAVGIALGLQGFVRQGLKGFGRVGIVQCFVHGIQRVGGLLQLLQRCGLRIHHGGRRFGSEGDTQTKR